MLHNAQHCLKLARRLRKSGEIVRAQKFEARAEQILQGHPLADELLSAWELSLEDDPINVPEWQNSGAFSQEDLLQAGVIDRIPHVTGGGL